MKREMFLLVAVVRSSGGCDWFTDPSPDQARQFDERGVLRARQPYRFAHTFNQAITQDIVVL